MWRVVLAVGGDVQDDLCPLGTLSEQLFSLKTPKPRCQDIQTIAHTHAPLWLQFPAGTCVHLAERTTCPKASGMEIAHSSRNAQFHPVLKPPLKKKIALNLSGYEAFICIPFHIYLSHLYFILTTQKKKKGRKKVIDTLTNSEWAFFLPSRFIPFPPPALHILSSPTLFFCKYP